MYVGCLSNRNIMKIKKVDYLAKTADETMGISAVFQIVTAYRYIVNDKPVEIF